MRLQRAYSYTSQKPTGNYVFSRLTLTTIHSRLRQYRLYHGVAMKQQNTLLPVEHQTSSEYMLEFCCEGATPTDMDGDVDTTFTQPATRLYFQQVYTSS